MIKDLIAAFKLINKTYNPYKDGINYSELYLFTNENIADITNKLNLKNKKILTVCSSSDQIFNFLLEDPTSIETFDINILTKYLFHLKRAAIITLSYEEFLKFFFPRKFFNQNLLKKETYQKISNNITNPEAKLFWDTIFFKIDSKNLYYSNLFIHENSNRETIIKCNKYLNNEQNYNKLAEKLLAFDNIKFYNLNLFNLNHDIKEKFNFIYLSNIFDKLQTSNKKEYLTKIKEIILNLSNILKEKGQIAVCYLYCYKDDYWGTIKNNNLQSIIQKSEFNMEHKLISFHSSLNYNSKRIKDRDALILYKKKQK